MCIWRVQHNRQASVRIWRTQHNRQACAFDVHNTTVNRAHLTYTTQQTSVRIWRTQHNSQPSVHIWRTQHNGQPCAFGVHNTTDNRAHLAYTINTTASQACAFGVHNTTVNRAHLMYTTQRSTVRIWRTQHNRSTVRIWRTQHNSQPCIFGVHNTTQWSSVRIWCTQHNSQTCAFGVHDTTDKQACEFGAHNTTVKPAHLAHTTQQSNVRIWRPQHNKQTCAFGAHNTTNKRAHLTLTKQQQTNARKYFTKNTTNAVQKTHQIVKKTTPITGVEGCTKSVTSLTTNSYFFILLRCVIVQKQAVEVEQRLFVILGLFKVHNCWKTAILHLHLFKKQNIEKSKKNIDWRPYI